MSKSAVRIVIEGAAIAAAATMLAVAPAAAATSCAPGSPSVLVHVAGFKQPQGRLKLSLYGPTSWLDKRGRISRSRSLSPGDRWTSGAGSKLSGRGSRVRHTSSGWRTDGWAEENSLGGC